MFLLYSSFVELVVDVDSRPDQYIQCFDNSTIAHEFVFNVFLEAASEHSHESIIVLVSDLGILLEPDCVFRGRRFLAQVLDDSNCRFFIVSDSKHESHILLKSIKVSKESISVSTSRSFFEELIEVRFNLVLSLSIYKRSSK